MKNIRLFRQIFLAALLILIPSIFATTWYGTRMIQSFYYQEMERDIGDRALLLRPHILQLLGGPGEQLQEFCRQTGRLATTRITVFDGSGTVLADSNENPAQMDNHGTRPEIRTAMTGEVGASLRFSRTLNQNMLYVAIPLHNDTPLDVVLRLSVPATTLNTVLSA
ncbi:MAG: PAS domain-containing sensor histidine kinase, partial [Desulfobulbaceae bacterium]|nr:PAS domain-containing sensor histidine kinase [Desulfobulbaceae bacterium]